MSNLHTTHIPLEKIQQTSVMRWIASLTTQTPTAVTTKHKVIPATLTGYAQPNEQANALGVSTDLLDVTDFYSILEDVLSEHTGCPSQPTKQAPGCGLLTTSHRITEMLLEMPSL